MKPTINLLFRQRVKQNFAFAVCCTILKFSKSADMTYTTKKVTIFIF